MFLSACGNTNECSHSISSQIAPVTKLLQNVATADISSGEAQLFRQASFTTFRLAKPEMQDWQICFLWNLQHLGLS